MEYLQESWFLYLDQTQQQLVDLAFQLAAREKELNSELHDYSFVVFPMAKAYEGFLKSYFYELALIDTPTFEGKKFRVGRALNPDIRRNQRDEFWLFDDVEHLCGEALARELWDTWLECRNRIFHYFPTEKHPITLPRANSYLEKMQQAMHAAVACQEDKSPVRRLRASFVRNTRASGI